jgi:hypothetical protein
MKSIGIEIFLTCLMLMLNWEPANATFNGKGGGGYGHEAGGHGGHGGDGYGKGGGGGGSGGGTSCIVKRSYCQCHYCKCEKGHLHCGSKKGGYGHDKG